MKLLRRILGWLWRKLPPVYVGAFGVTGDGATDDTAAIQAAYAYANGRPVVFGPGNYKVTGRIDGGTGPTMFQRGALLNVAVAVKVKGGSE